MSKVCQLAIAIASAPGRKEKPARFATGDRCTHSLRGTDGASKARHAADVGAQEARGHKILARTAIPTVHGTVASVMTAALRVMGVGTPGRSAAISWKPAG